MGRFFRSSLRTGRIYRSSNYGQFTQSMSPNYKNQWLADGGHRPRQSAAWLAGICLCSACLWILWFQARYVAACLLMMFKGCHGTGLVFGL